MYIFADMKPKVICHIMGSVDGRLLPSCWTAPYGDVDAAELFKEYAAIGRTLGADAWMFGKATTQEFFPGRLFPGSDKRAEADAIHKAERRSERLFITIDPDADILFTAGTLRGDDMLVVTDTGASADYLDMLRDKGISYMVTEPDAPLADTLAAIGREFGVKTISLQGGGIIDGAVLAAGVIDELSLVVYPGIDGSAASPSIFEYLGAPNCRPAVGQALELLGVERRAHGVVWMRYRFHKVK